MSDNRRRRREEDDSESENELPPSSPQQPFRGGIDPISSPIGAPDMINPEGDDNEVDDVPDIDEVEEQMNEVDLMGDDMYGDYATDRNRDTYDPNQVDDRQQQELSLSERRRIDAQLNERDRLLRNVAYMDDEDEEQEGAAQLDEMGLPVQRRRRRRQYEDLENSDDDLLSDRILIH